MLTRYNWTLLAALALTYPANAISQQYEIQLVGTLVGSGESLIKATKSGLILLERKGCPYVYSTAKKKATKLCDAGLTTAYDINEGGTVVGRNTTNDLSYPVAWNAKSGLTRLPLLSGTSEGIAFGINRKGEIVGFNAARVTRPVDYFNDINGDGICDEASEGPCITQTYQAVAFRYSAESGIARAFDVPNDTISIATAINNQGALVGWVGSSPGVGASEFNLVHQRADSSSGAPAAPTVLESKVYAGHPQDIDASGFSLFTFSGLGAVTLNDSAKVLWQRTLYDITSGTKKDAFQGFHPYRSDFPQGVSIDSQGRMLSAIGGYYILQTPARRATQLSCLIPQNQSIRGLGKRKPSSLFFQGSPVFQGNDILVHADISGDNSDKTPLFRIKRLPREKFGDYYSFCPEVRFQQRCVHNNKTQTTFDHTLIPEANGAYQNRSALCSAGDLSPYCAEIPDGAACSTKLTVSAAGKPLPQVSGAYHIIDGTGPLGAPCTPRKITTFSTNDGGDTPTVEFRAKAEILRVFTLSSEDRRFRFLTPESSSGITVRISDGDGSSLSSPECAKE